MDSVMNDEILLALGRLEGKVDALISRQTILDRELEKSEQRIRAIEQAKSWLVGAAAALGAATSLLIQWVTKGST
tara:strand:- start:6 stop:230 length:225 start_codon:yes stop_codon:yes gene_type:complete